MKRPYIAIAIIFILALFVLLFLKCGGPGKGAGKFPAIPVKIQPRLKESKADYVINPSAAPAAGKNPFGIWVVKLDAGGKMLWQKIFPGKYNEWADMITQVKDGGFIIASKSFTNGEDYDGVSLMKLDAKGNSLWVKRFDQSSTGEFSEPLKNGSLVTGRTYSEDNKNYGVFIAKTDSKGDYIYTKTLGSDYLSWGYSAVASGDGHFVTTGMPEEYGNNDDSDVYLMQRDKKGGYAWTKKFGGDKYDRGYSVEPAGDGGFIISGLTCSYGAGLDDMYLIRTDVEGNSIWTRTYGGPGEDRAYDGIRAHDTGYIFAGVTSSYGAGGYDAYVLKTDADGNSLWALTYGGPDDDSAHSICATDDGGYIFAGATDSR